MKLFYAGYQPEASGFGWATANRYLVKELSKLCDVITATGDTDKMACQLKGCAAFVPLVDHDLNPCAHVRADINLGYCFFESELGPKAAENAARYDVVFCGSTWCLDRMKERGIANGRVLIQGVDHSIFKPDLTGANRGNGEFRIFSGGKFEYRKGQDIVIAAVKKLLQEQTEGTERKIKLVTAWHNPWPGLINASLQEMDWRCKHIKANFAIDPAKLQQPQFFDALTSVNGIPSEHVEHHGQLSQPELAAVMNSADLGVFPNRCEGGTNLVLMEYMACGKPVVGSWQTGHWDLLQDQCRLYPQPKAGWHETEPSRLVDSIEMAMEGAFVQPWKSMQQFTWERAARQIVETVKELA